MRVWRSLLAAVLAIASAPAMATPILYTFTGLLSGSLDGERFNRATSIFTFASDTDLVFRPNPISQPTLYNTPPGTLNFIIDGVSGSFVSPFNAFAISFPFIGLVGVTEVGESDLLDVADRGLIGYDLRSEVGPIVNAPIDFLNFNTRFATTAGELIIGPSPRGMLAFTARFVGGGAVPEPGSWALVIVGSGAVGAGLRRRTRAPRVTIVG